jgi:hypothetical protein
VLALRVLEQAILDATSAIPRCRARSQCRPLEDEQWEALRFLTDSDGNGPPSARPGATWLTYPWNG